MKPQISGTLLGLTLGTFASTLSLTSPLAQLGLLALGLYAFFGRWSRFHWLTWLAIAVILYSSLLAIGGSRWYFRNTNAAEIYALWTTLMVILIARGGSVSRWTWWIVLAFWLGQAVLIIWQAMAVLPFGWFDVSWLPWAYPPKGTMDSRTVAGGFMVLGIVWALGSRKPLLAFPMIVAMLFTGSRLSLVVAIVCIMGMAWKRSIMFRTVLGLGLLTILISGITWDYTAHVFRVGGGIAKVQNDFLGRLRPATIPTLVPQGPIGMTENTHNVFLRMAIEQGIPAALAWLGLSLAALWRRPRYTPTWWMLLGFMGLTTLEYFPLYPLVLSAFWWVLVGERLQGAVLGNTPRKLPRTVPDGH